MQQTPTRLQSDSTPSFLPHEQPTTPPPSPDASRQTSWSWSLADFRPSHPTPFSMCVTDRPPPPPFGGGAMTKRGKIGID
ncbi:hypothetical protein HanXRQr2_Chr15g0714271 [Helianthus annuus]|uniref:Uncharacterized protein n=1 Tax=Helianthus annuus TaxID=4232 RepID=A0A251SBJ5_HELAN|nr:hypothetical protein HanXRQr2_Chr15g0714271 [Helianthus annuus]KAJ0833021.1 hypothetical protein HanPSC8_Chr15g0685451 [Helianthus annuus]